MFWKLNILYPIITVSFVFLLLYVMNFDGVLIFYAGCVMGSFVSCVGYRIFHPNLALLANRSVCPQCLHTISPWLMIPIFSYIFQFGRCGKCQQKISLLYPIIEICTGAAYLLTYRIFGFDVLTAVVLIVITLSMINAISDIHYYMLSDIVTILTMPMVCIFAYLKYSQRYYESMYYLAFAILITATFFVLLRYIVRKDVMGTGDLKIIVAFSPILNSLNTIVYVMFVSGIVSLLFGFAWRRMTFDAKEFFPFAPSLLFAMLMNILCPVEQFYFW